MRLLVERTTFPIKLKSFVNYIVEQVTLVHQRTMTIKMKHISTNLTRLSTFNYTVCVFIIFRESVKTMQKNYSWIAWSAVPDAKSSKREHKFEKNEKIFTLLFNNRGAVLEEAINSKSKNVVEVR